MIGEVDDARDNRIPASPTPELYTSLLQRVPASLTVLARTAGPPARFGPLVRAAIWSVDPSLPLHFFYPLAAVRAAAEAAPRFQAGVMAGFGLLALALAALGVYAVFAYAVARRTRELGLRLALGAQPQAVRRLLLGDGARLAAWGAALGLLGSLAASRWLRSQLFAVSPLDPWLLAAATALLVLVALAACDLAARRALAIDPAVALREG